MTNLSTIKLPANLRKTVIEAQRYIAAFTANKGKPPIRVLISAKTHKDLTEKVKSARAGRIAAFDGRLEVDGIPFEIISNG